MLAMILIREAQAPDIKMIGGPRSSGEALL